MMDFPIAGVTLSPILLTVIGFLVGVLGGIFGSEAASSPDR